MRISVYAALLRSRISLRLMYLGLAAAGLACGGTTEPLPACSAALSVAVMGGRTPTISWTPECGVRAVVVSEVVVDSPGIAPSLWRWSLSADEPLIEPPLRYGRAPRGALASTAQPLEAGRSYMVSVWNHPDAQHLPLGSTIFTP